MIGYCLTGGIGDAILSLPVIKALSREYGEGISVCYFNRNVGQVLEGNADLERADFLDINFASERRTLHRHFSDCRFIVFNRFYRDNDGDLNYFYASDDSELGEIRKRKEMYRHELSRAVGHRVAMSPSPTERLAIANFLSAEDDYYVDFKRFGLDVEYDDVELALSEDAVKVVSEYGMGDYAIVHDSRMPNTNGDGLYAMKSWYLDRWNEVCAHLSDKHGLRVVKMSEVGQPIFDGVTFHTEIIGDRPQFADYLALLSRCRIYVGTDSWPSHAAICLRDPKYVFLKGAVSKRWDHGGRFGRTIRMGGCQSCEGIPGSLDTCIWEQGTKKCMDLITVDEVVRAIDEELSE